VTVWVGIDLVSREDVEDALSRHGRRYLDRVFTEHEIGEARGHALRLAASFAAKEATAKALRVGDEPFSWRDIRVEHDGADGPRLVLTGAAGELAKRRGVRSLSLSLDRCATSAMAVVVADLDGGPPR
jgi:holo-[acyl-carrier protein] synthase